MVNIKKLFSKENRNKTLALGLTGVSSSWRNSSIFNEKNS